MLAVAGSLALAACGSDSDSGSDGDTGTDSVAATAATDSTPADTSLTGTAPTGTSPTGTATSAAAFPVTIEHVYGETTIEAEPQRVVSIGFAEHESILALGVTPIAVRDWYGDQPYATWPWAQDELGDAEPEVLPSTELNFEQIAALEPDLIIGVSSGIEEGDYETLSKIAPTVTRTGEQLYGTPWREQLQIIGQALGRSDVAEQVIADTEAKFAAVREEHPEFDGLEAAIAFEFEGKPGAYASEDSRAQILGEFGFVTPAEFDELSGDQFYFTVSPEELSIIDRDVIVWLASDEATLETLQSMPLRPTLTAYAEGREVIADPLLAGAFSHASPLSIEFVIDELVPQLALAADGDPATAVS